MIENSLELGIIALYDDNLVNLFSINSISKQLGRKYPYINKKVTSLLKQGILKKIVIGKSYMCSLNFDNDKTILLLQMLELQKKARLDTGKIDRFIGQTRLRMTLHCVLEFDRRLVFVVENLGDRRELQREFKNCTVVDKKEFLGLIADEKRLFTGHTVIYGAERFFELLKIELDELKRIHSPLSY